MPAASDADVAGNGTGKGQVNGSAIEKGFHGAEVMFWTVRKETES